jgi:hypothetical protein
MTDQLREGQAPTELLNAESLNTPESVSPKRMDWQQAKRAALNLVADLPEYTHEMIIQEYKDLVAALSEEDVRRLLPKQRAFEMNKRFPRFAVAYSSLFMLACNRDTPMPVAAVESLLKTAELQKSGLLTEGKARGIVMDLAEAHRRRRDDER